MLTWHVGSLSFTLIQLIIPTFQFSQFRSNIEAEGVEFANLWLVGIDSMLVFWCDWSNMKNPCWHMSLEVNNDVSSCTCGTLQSFELLSSYGNSQNFKWAGDASKFQQTSAMEPYIEYVTSPNNPCGSRNRAIVNGTGPVVHDLAYYWPQYTPITAPADHPVMLWTISKLTGHAGTRLG